MSRILDELREMLEHDEAHTMDHTGPEQIGDPESATVSGTSQELVAANGVRFVLIGNDSLIDVYLAVGKTAEAQKGILLPAGATRTVTLPNSTALNAITSAAPALLVWQAFG